MDANQKKEIQQMIEQTLRKSFGKRIGDTPTDSFQLTNKKYVDNQTAAIGSVFGGVIGANGVPTAYFPAGWTSSQLGAGDYIVTHNIGSSVYSLVVSSAAFTTNIFSKDANTFEVNSLTAAGAGTNQQVNFIVKK